MNELIDDIKELADALEAASKWPDSEATVTMATDGSRDYIYEFFCLMRLLNGLARNYRIEFIPGKKYKNKFPQKAGKKENFPRFHLTHGFSKDQFQLCVGTGIATQFEDQTIYPDISLQKGTSSLRPNQDDILMIWDAKHIFHPKKREKKKDKSGKKKRKKDGKIKNLPKNVLRDFAEIVRTLELEGESKVILQFHPETGLNGNCLITNAGPHDSSLSEKYLRSRSIKLVYGFDHNKEYKTLG